MSASGENRKNKPTIAEILASKTSLPSDLLLGEFRLEIRGRNTVIINGCRRILDYSPEFVRVSIKNESVGIRGERLVCSSYHDGAICIEGHIDGIVFESEEDG